MGTTSGAKPPPKPIDLEGWRQAIADGRLARFRLEAIVAAFQDLGPNTDPQVRDALARHLSRAIVGMLRKRVDYSHPNNGEDIILEVHDKIFEALLQPASADGKGLRQAFGPRVIFRMKSAIADDLRGRVVPAQKSAKSRERLSSTAREQPAEESPAEAEEGPAEQAEPDADEGDEYQPGKSQFDCTLMDGVRKIDEQIDVDRIVETIPNFKKKLAFRLYMDDVPFKSGKGNSIAKACGVSERTAREWIKEIEADLKLNKEVQALWKLKAGEQP